MSSEYLHSYLQLEIITGILTPPWIHTSKATLSDTPNPQEEIWRKRTTQVLKEFFIRLNKEILPKSFIEIGAHEASISVELKRQGVPTVHAIEANPFVFNKYEADLNNLGIKYLNFAVSNTNNEVEISIPLFSEVLDRADGSLLKRTADANYKTVKVLSKKLSNHIQDEQLDDISIWIDTEGLTLEVIKSAEPLLDRVMLIHAEVEDINYWKDQDGVLEVFKYLFENNFVAIARDMDGRGQYNVIFANQKYLNKLGGLISDYWKDLSALKNQNNVRKKLKFF